MFTFKPCVYPSDYPNFSFTDVQCSELANNPFKQMCEGPDGYKSWDANTWNNGNGCIEGCKRWSKVGCCEARSRAGGSRAYCRFYPNGKIIDGYGDCKATLCSTGILKINENVMYHSERPYYVY